LGYDRINPFEVGEYYPCESMKLHRICRRTVQSDPVYAAMIENLDWNTGRLLDALEEEGILDETLVVFASDNGGESSTCGSPTSNAPLAEGKGWMYEGGTRGPLIIRYPSLVRAGSICSVPTTTPDFYPTFLDLARVPGSREHRIDGVSIAGLLRGGTQLDREAIYWHYPHYSNQGGRPACSVRGGNLKLIEFFDLNRVELYDLAVDPGERENLASARPEDVSRLRAALHDWLESSGAQFPEPNPDYRPETWPQ
jgi:arylsulfatase A-like enzyme